MDASRILIVEDEVLIANTIERYLIQHGYQVVGFAISYEEAKMLYLQEKPDVALLDIRLSGTGTGIDVARFIREQASMAPFIFLTSQLDSISIDLAKQTFPAGYLSKPIQKESLYTTIEMALYAHAAQEQTTPTFRFYDGVTHYNVPLHEISYLQADHIYVQVYIVGGGKIIQRQPLIELLEALPAGQFVQTHRSYAVNRRLVTRWDRHHVYVGRQVIPLSRSRRSEVLALLGGD